ncbi:DNA polymerase phi-domain-containing protein [Pisolithus sp. B1]|nr:DNA polymerase phi-domain-containing protein [Pisolithus sp. B1]
MSTTLPLFWDLSSASKKERVDASVKLISALEQFQINHAPPQEGSDTEDGGGDALDLLNSPDVSYSIRRLVRGLASPRESSRLGFSVALTELLSRINTVTCTQVVSLISDSSKKQGSMTGQEERDILFARLFGLTAVIRSGLLVRQTPLPSSGSSNTQVSSIESYEEVLKKLIEIGEAKSWLRESAWWTVGLAIDAVQDSSVSWKAKALGTTVEYLFSKDKESFWSPEKVAMTLKLQPLWPNHDWDSTLAPVFKGPNILSAGNLAPLGRVLKESALDDEEASNPGSGSWKPQIHFVWDMLFDRLLPTSDSKQAPQGSFGEFFRIVVDESLFSSTSSAERKYWGFQVFKKALTRVSTDQLPMLFTKNLMRSWINHLSKSDRYLHKISLDVAKHIQSFVQENPALGFPLILQLTGINGSQEFDKLTRTKTVESILTVMDSEGIKNYIVSLLSQVDSKDADEDTAALNSRRTWIADQFAALIRNGSVPKSDEWIQVILDWYAVNGLYSIRKKSGSSSIQALRALPSPPFTEEFQAHCRTRLLSSLADLTSQTTVMKKGDITHKETAVASDGEFWISKVLSTLARLDKDTKHVDPLAPVDEETQAVLDRVGKVHEKLGKVSSEKREVARGFELVLSSLVLQCRCGEEDSVENLESCLSAASRMFASKKSSKKKSEQSALPADDEPEPIDVLVDLLIGYLENASAYTRSVANEAFSRVTGAAQESTIDLILTQLERRKPAELAEAREEVTDASSEEEDESSSEASDDDGSVSEESDDEDAQEIPNEIVDLLKTSGTDDDEDNESDEESEELMDDEQMMAIDGHLAEIFRSRKDEQRSKKGVDAQREATHFKNRVLDLIDTFVKREPQSPLNIRLILPLIDLVTKSGMDEKQLSDKAKGVLKNRLAKSKDVPADGRRDEVETILREIHQRVRKSHSAENLSVLSQSSLYLCRVLVQLNGDDCVVHIYQESLDDYISRKASQANLSFFQDFVRRFPALGSKLRDPLLAASSSAVNAYRRCQAFQLLSVILSQHGKVCDDQAIASSFQKNLQKTVLELASGAVDDQSSLSASQLKDLLKVVLLCIRQVQKSDSPPRKTGIWDPAAWNALHVRLAACERFKSSSPLLNMCRQVESVASQLKPPIQNGDGGKRKADEVVDITDSSKKSDRKKQRKSKS